LGLPGFPGFRFVISGLRLLQDAVARRPACQYPERQVNRSLGEAKRNPGIDDLSGKRKGASREGVSVLAWFPGFRFAASGLRWLRIPEEGHAGEHRERDERADPEVDSGGLPVSVLHTRCRGWSDQGLVKVRVRSRFLLARGILGSSGLGETARDPGIPFVAWVERSGTQGFHRASFRAQPAYHSP
jgi:hypothetical protein